MSVISAKLGEIGYAPLYEEDAVAPHGRGELAAASAGRLPDDYLEFLAEFPRTGMVGPEVICQGIAPSPWAPKAEYAISLLYASCSNGAFDLVARRKDPYEAWDFGEEFLVIGDDVGGNFYCLDLRDQTFGQIYFWDHEQAEEETGLYLVADSFASFISRLRKRSPT